MNTGITLNEMAARLTREQEQKADYVADTRRMQFITVDEIEGVEPAENRQPGTSVLDLIGEGAPEEARDLTILPHAHRQISDVLQIPWRYYDRLRQTSGLRQLLDRNVNSLFHHRAQPQMLRTMDGRVRAFLSDRYRRLDNYDLAEVLVPILGEIPDLKFQSCWLDDERMYIKAFTPRVSGHVKVGEEVCAGVFISNSEVGAGKFRVEPFVYTLACTNGMVVSKSLAESISRIHVGRRIQTDDNMRVFRDETLQADDRAFFMAAADVVRAAVDEVRFRELVEAMRAAAESRPVQSAPAAVQTLARAESLTDGERDSVLTHLAAGGDLSKWGLLSAVTRHAEDVDSYQRATELEELGGKILAYSDREWNALATAAS